ncbi:MAG: AMP-binding protein, partial [Clostridia bacterium]|nr:AMP-binding protein [Clostridia bacterium]
MKLSFCSKQVKTNTFLDLCNKTANYGFSGFEIYDAVSEMNAHADSIFNAQSQTGAKRKLVNRHIAISAIKYPEKVDKNVDVNVLSNYVELCATATCNNLIIELGEIDDLELFKVVLMPVVNVASKLGVSILIETRGKYANTNEILDVINVFGSAVLGVSWDIRETFFTAKETADQTIQTLGAYVNYVRIGDMRDGKKVLIGDGDLPVEEFMNALKSLNYDGYVCAEWNDEITDEDIVLTHFTNFIDRITGDDNNTKPIYYNRDKTGTFPWKKYEVIDLTFSEVLDEMATRYPDQYAFKYTTLDYTRTYQEFREDVDRVAAALISLGVKPGHHVAIWATNVPEWFLTFWATVKIGAVLVTVNTAYKIHETEYLLRQSDTHTLVMIDSCKDSNYKEIIEELCPELKTLTPGNPLYSKKLPFLRNVVTVGFKMDGCLEWNEMVERSNLVPKEEVLRRAAQVKPDDVCNMQYTSGTTGFPKGVMLTHRNIVNNGKTIGDRMDISTADRMMIQVPMFHCFGMVLSMTNLMTHGGTICPMPYFSPKSSLACINNEKITCFNGVPTMFIAMFAHEDFSKTDFSYMRTGIMAGANCPADLMRRASVEMNMREIISVYGQTEASPGCTMGEVNED